MSTPGAGRGADALRLSGLLRRTVVDPDGGPLGRVRDVVVRLRPAEYPLVVGLVADVDGHRVFLPVGDVARWPGERLVATTRRVDARAFERRAGEVLLRSDVLGHRLVDIVDARLVRAYDVQLTGAAGGLVVSGVGTRRPAWFRRGPRRPEPFQDWTAFEALIGHQGTVLVRSSFGRLRRLRAAQLADLLEDASHDEQAEILAQVHVDPELEADVYEELDDHRGALLAARSDREIAEVLAHMRTDDAADALADLPQHRRARVLDLLPTAQRAAVRDLLTYNETTAGGLMGLEFLAVPDQLTVDQALAAVRGARGAPVEASVTLHLVDGTDRLTGTVPLIRLVQSDPRTPAIELADTDPVRVGPDTDLADLAVLMADHNLPTLPVVDQRDGLLGVITIDDVLPAVIPTAWRDREPATRPVRGEDRR